MFNTALSRILPSALVGCTLLATSSCGGFVNNHHYQATPLQAPGKTIRLEVAPLEAPLQHDGVVWGRGAGFRAGMYNTAIALADGDEAGLLLMGFWILLGAGGVQQLAVGEIGTGVGALAVATSPGWIGMAMSHSGSDLEKASQEMEASLDRAALKKALHQSLTQAASGLPYELSSSQEADLLLSIQPLGIYSSLGERIPASLPPNEEDEFDPQTRFYLALKTTLVDQRSGKVLKEQTYLAESDTRPFLSWATNQAKPFREAVAQMARESGEELLDNFFEQPSIVNTRSASRCSFQGVMVKPSWNCTTQTSLENNQLTWSPYEILLTETEKNQIQEVRYEVMVFEAAPTPSGPTRGSRVFHRKDLAEPMVAVEGLTPKQQYLWTVRAHYKVNGRAAHTPWAQQSSVNPGLFLINSKRLDYQFSYEAR